MHIHLQTETTLRNRHMQACSQCVYGLITFTIAYRSINTIVLTITKAKNKTLNDTKL